MKLSDSSAHAFKGVYEYGCEVEPGGMFYIVRHADGEFRVLAERVVIASFVEALPDRPVSKATHYAEF